jgi:Rho-binding antiterminator
MNSEHAQYHPINCEFHDLLEELATLRTRVQFSFRDSTEIFQHRQAVIADVFACDGAEYLALTTGETLRLDWLVEVGGARLADHGGSPTCAP